MSNRSSLPPATRRLSAPGVPLRRLVAAMSRAFVVLPAAGVAVFVPTASIAQTLGPGTSVPYVLDQSGHAGGTGAKGQGDSSTAGTGGTGGPGNPINAELLPNTALLPSSSPSSVPSVSLTSNGGAGGTGGPAYDAGSLAFANGGAGGTAGVGGTISFQLDLNANIVSLAAGGGAIGITSNGGRGGDGGPSANRGAGGTPSDGAAGGSISFGTVQYSQVFSPSLGIAAVTLSATGGDGGTQPNGQSTNIRPAHGAMGGAGGMGGAIQSTSSGIGGVILSSAGSGVVALSQGGHGNDGGFADSGGSERAKGGDGGAGGAGGTISLTLAGSGAFITAQGPSGATGAQINVDGPNNTTLPAATASQVAGVLALSLGGTGGNGGIADGDFNKATAGSGGVAGSGGFVGVTTSGGTVQTTGYGAAGILGLSAGGSGGDGGNAGSVFRAHGGNGAPGGDGNQVRLFLCRTGACQSSSGSGSGPAVISTTGEDADAVIALSVGGGGGYGGDVNVAGVGASIAIGGQGALGGNGGSVSVQNGYYSPPSISAPQNGHVISTEGEYARGLVAQSVGGGGGRGGDASATDFGIISLSIGGVGGSGGDAVDATVLNGGIVQTAGAHSIAMDAQSVGGGGGAGGAATSVTVGAQVTTAVAIGGSGGAGGNGFNAYAANFGQVGTLGDSAIGLFAQSVGGGGGHGGASVAKTFQVYSSQDPPVPSVNLTVSVGGFGGLGGSGGSAFVDNTGVVFTGGQNSHAMVAQSVGGGGGDGGAATAYSQQFRASTLSVSTVIGGKGGIGGIGDTAQARNGGLVWTLGGGSYGVIAQSVGGGGGAGGYGEADTGAFRGGATPNLQATVVLGGSGGLGNVGGSVTVDNYLQPDPQGPVYSGSILTRGDHSVGIFAQSVGGGGGIGAHSLAQGSGGQINVNVALGGSGGSGDHGGTVVVDNGAGAILTAGASSHAIFAQSVGGGGGHGGDAATGSGTDPELAAYTFIANGAGIGQGNQVIANIYDLKDNLPTNADLSGRLATLLTTYETQNDAAAPQPPVPEQQSFASKLTVDVGVGVAGKAGSGGNGGSVTVMGSQGGSIETRGPGSYGILAQSVGGSGGDGGASHAATANDVIPGSRLNAAVGIGGGGSSSGDGGAIVVDNAGSITTAGDLSHAIFAQSVGGGGGTGGLTVPRAPALFSFDIGIGGNGGASGNGGAVTVNGLQWARINTAGTGAVGIAAQSVGGGGGLATLMSSDAPGGGGRAKSSGGPFDIPSTSLFRLVVSGTDGSSGQGGAVNVVMNGPGLGGDNATPYVITTGTDAYGVLAQSVGSGGGWYSGIVPVGSSLSTLLPAAGTSSGNGGTVAVTLDNQAFIYTSGAGAVGILAQSVGGGGGLVGGMSLVKVDQGFTTTLNARSGQGGNVTISLQDGGNIVTNGTRAHGIFAQSVGGGGGVLSQTDGSGYTFAGSGSYTGCSGTSCTGAVAVTLGNGTVVRALGPEAYAIFAQSRGNGINDALVTVSPGGLVESWNQSAGGIYMDAAGSNTIVNQGTIDDGTLTNGGKVSDRGVAIVGTQANTVVTNTGTINGSISLGAGSRVDNLGGAFLQAPTVDLGGRGVLTNAGTIDVGGRATATMRVNGNFVQQPGGTLVLDVDPARQRNDVMRVDGRARLDGRLLLRAGSLTPDPIAVVQSSGAADVTGLQVTDAGGGRLFGYRASSGANGASVTPYASLGTSARDQSLSGGRVALADHLQNGFVHGLSAGQATLYAQLAALPDGQSYRLALDNLSGETLQAAAVAAHASSLAFAERMNDCPTLDSQGLLAERRCGWLRVIENRTHRSAGNDSAGFSNDTQTLQAGGQTDVADGWFVGGSIGYEHGRTSADETRGSVSGDGGSVGVVVKREIGPWLLAASADYGRGRYDTQRTIVVGTIQSSATGAYDLSHAGLHGRVAYRLEQTDWYLKPYVDGHVVRMRSGGFDESGAGDLDLRVDARTGTIYSLSPMVELGTHRTFDNGMRLNGFVALGALLQSGARWGASSRLEGSSGAVPFNAMAELPNRLGKAGLGVDVGWKNKTLRLEYGGAFGSGYTSQGASAKLAIVF